MTKEKNLLYHKAYVELYEFIQLLSKTEQNKISKNFINYIYNNRDTDYVFFIDSSKDLLEQDYMLETKALIVKMYEKYLAPENEKEFWKNYDKICLNMIEEEKKNRYNPNDIFHKAEHIHNQEKGIENIKPNNLPVTVKRENIFARILRYIKRFLQIG